MPKTLLYVLSGPIHSGKTSLLVRILTELKEQRRSLNGLLSLACFEEGEFQGYNGYGIGTGETFSLIRMTGEAEWDRIGSFYFIPEGMRKAQAHIMQITSSRLTVIDEMGPLELEGKGFWPSFLNLKDVAQPVLTVIRNELLPAFIPRFGIQPRVFSLAQADVAGALQNELSAILK